MSRKEPNRIKIEREIVVEPDDVFESEVVKSGGGAVVKAFKRHIGKKAVVIIRKT